MNENSAVTKGTWAAGFSVASVWFGTHVGAGFATGNQVLSYFVNYGWTAVIFPLISMGILAYVIYVIITCLCNIRDHEVCPTARP